jgi:hypothetical protein
MRIQLPVDWPERARLHQSKVTGASLRQRFPGTHADLQWKGPSDSGNQGNHWQQVQLSRQSKASDANLLGKAENKLCFFTTERWVAGKKYMDKIR